MKKALLVLVLLLTSSNLLFAVVYETCNSGTWGNNAGSSTIRFSTDGGATCTINPYSITWVAGDILVIKAGTTVTITSPTVTITPRVTLRVYGNIIFDGGKLSLDNNSSLLTMYAGSSITCTGGCGSSDQLIIGSGGSKHTYNGSELDAINNAPRPTNVNNTGTLPVTLLFFRATVHSDHVELLWATASEENFDRFVIEKTIDTKEFFEIGSVAGAGTSVERIDYSFKDMNPTVGKTYYRLKAVDFDGSFEYFGVVAVQADFEKNVVIFPNPSSGNAINIRANFNPSEQDRVTIFNQFGVDVAGFRMTNYKETLIFSEPLKPGLYLIKYSGSGFEKTIRTVIR